MYKKIVMFLLVGLLSCSLFVCAFASEEHAAPAEADPLDMVMNYISSFGSWLPVFGFLTEQFYWGPTGATIAGAAACVILGVLVMIKVWYWVLDFLGDLSNPFCMRK